MNIVSPAVFATATGVRMEKSLSNGFSKSSSMLRRIYDDLEMLHRPDHGKQFLEKRWSLMITLMLKCRTYLDVKGRKGRDMTSAKYQVVARLENELNNEYIKERSKAQAYGALVNQPARGPHGIAMGLQSAHADVRFERAFHGLKGNGTVVHGADAHGAAVKAGIKFTGDDSRDAYALRAFIKQQIRNQNLDLETLEYLTNANQRAQYELSFSTSRVWQNGSVFDTSQCFIEGEDGAATMVISEAGDWYARAGKQELTGGRWHHSSFLAGESVLLAGTIKTSARGTLQYISNSSGHYSPTLDQLLEGIRLIKVSGLNTHYRLKVSILALDFQGMYGPPAKYMFPYALFKNKNGLVPNPANYEVYSKFSE